MSGCCNWGIFDRLAWCLSKSVSPPRRCSYCQRVMFFKYYRCRHCRYKCHKKCAGSSSQKCKRTSSIHAHAQCQKVPITGDDHWSKLLQANEVNSNVVVVPDDGRHYCHHPSSRRRKRHISRESKSSTDSANIFSNLYDKFCQWIASRRKDHPDNVSMCSSGAASTRFDCSYEEVCDSLQGFSFSQSHYLPDGGGDHHGHHERRVSPTDTDLFWYQRTRQSSISSTYEVCSVASYSTSTSYSEILHDREREFFSFGEGSRNLVPEYVFDWQKSNEKYLSLSPAAVHGALVNTFSCPPKTTKTLPVQKRRGTQESLCATWPPSGRKLFAQDDDDLDASLFDEVFISTPDTPHKEKDPKAALRESLGECSIPYNDLRIGECVRVGRNRAIYKGHWHGEVMIHAYEGIEDDQVQAFWEEIAKLSMIRHENIALFMGACIEPPHLAVITSVRNGASLYEQIHIKRERMGQHSRVNITRQIAQALGYLHAKGIVMRTLNSQNIFLESKVKICLMDYGMAESRNDREDYGCIPRGHLTYIAPECLSTMYIEPPRLVQVQPFIKATDIFAFGTVLYELMCGQFPFHGCHAQALIYGVCKGKRTPLKHLRCSVKIKNLIRDCWSETPKYRPDFSHINRELNDNAALHKRHSSSEPERMNRVGSLARAGTIKYR
ncbi:uncharacterized protein LOC135482744 isoform X2 [Lineus longissimus]|uniref:uncharacterized protein LOC135482744 isoform X2 n=1 Tax=Lineus longissimus TaxID=88925 RepID=UPI002B4DC5B1